MTEILLFALFSLAAVFFAFNVVFRKNAVHSALHLVGVLLSLSGLFVLLNAQFIAAIQILVYAGAIMVLFLFVVMLLNVKGESPLLTPGAAKGFGFLFALLAFVELLWIVLSNLIAGEGTP
ncbi:MAG TPA: NADH-quinone oxidoreductase subunit J, partial [Candidatus Polarisedimenticolia bacterium]|nr:NADH-quinone oxidoreductase subunit J [Candidatus Polarisedimenticolia bacterium]